MDGPKISEFRKAFIDAFVTRCEGFEDVRDYLAPFGTAREEAALAAIDGDPLVIAWSVVSRKIRMLEDFDALDEAERAVVTAAFGEDVFAEYEDRAGDLVAERLASTLDLRARGERLFAERFGGE